MHEPLLFLFMIHILWRICFEVAHKGGFFYGRGIAPGEREEYMQFFASAITTLQTLVVALGAGLGVWGVVNLLEGYGSDNPGANAHVR